MTENKQLAHSLESKARTKDVILEENISFKSLLLPDNILRGLSDAGFQKPSPIQIKALPIGRCGFDLIVKSKSGTGKTLVFGVIALETIKLHKLDAQALILAPTREIAVQIEDVLTNIGKYFEGLNVQSFIGGLPLTTDKAKCSLCHIAVGTPGRVKQLIKEGALGINSIKLFVLDEADKLMENSFQNDITEIFNSLPNRKQVIMCSATYPNELNSFLDNYMLSPTFLSAELETPLLLGLKHFVRLLKSSPNVVQQTKVKNEELLKILTAVSFTQCLIFSNYQTRAESISNFLNRNAWNSTFISGAQSQTERLSSLSSLKEFKCKILLSTDLTSRGIDAANVDLVINYDIPVDAMTYLHRMGRAGRYGSTGNCINLALVGQETKILQNILGIIGGQNLSIPILDESLNVENAVVSKENLLFAEVPTNVIEFANKCKTELIEMKKKTSQNNNRKEKNNDTKSKSSGDAEMVNQVIEGTFSDMDISSVLGQLASGSLEWGTNVAKDNTDAQINNLYKELCPSSSKSCLDNESKSNSDANNFQSTELDPVSILQQLSQADAICKSTEGKSDDKKRKRSQNSPNIQEEEILKKEHPTDEIFCKNKALFTVAKAFSNVETCEDDTEYLTEYLSLLRAKEKYETNDVIGKEEEGAEKTTKINIVRNEKDQDILENIFLLAYKCQVEACDKWQDLLPEEEKKKLEDNYVSEKNQNQDYDEFEEERCDEYGEVEYDDEEYDEDYDFEMEKEIKVNVVENAIQDPNDYSFMNWIPVEPANSQYVVQNCNKITNLEKKTRIPENASSVQRVDIFKQPSTTFATTNDSSYYNDRFSKYYQHCSSSLWQTGLSFETVQSFDEWFCYNWQNQIAAVRNFVQKNIYLKEMGQNQQE